MAQQNANAINQYTELEYTAAQSLVAMRLSQQTSCFNVEEFSQNITDPMVKNDFLNSANPYGKLNTFISFQISAQNAATSSATSESNCLWVRQEKIIANRNTVSPPAGEEGRPNTSMGSLAPEEGNAPDTFAMDSESLLSPSLHHVSAILGRYATEPNNDMYTRMMASQIHYVTPSIFPSPSVSPSLPTNNSIVPRPSTSPFFPPISPPASPEEEVDKMLFKNIREQVFIQSTAPGVVKRKNTNKEDHKSSGVIHAAASGVLTVPKNLNFKNYNKIDTNNRKTQKYDCNNGNQPTSPGIADNPKDKPGRKSKTPPNVSLRGKRAPGSPKAKLHCCPHCENKYSKSSHLKSHINAHIGLKPHHCHFRLKEPKGGQEFCGKSFVRSDELTRHQKTHTGEKNYFCDYDGCGKRFSRADHLIKHKRTHLNKLSRQKGMARSAAVASSLTANASGSSSSATSCAVAFPTADSLAARLQPMCLGANAERSSAASCVAVTSAADSLAARLEPMSLGASVSQSSAVSCVVVSVNDAALTADAALTSWLETMSSGPRLVSPIHGVTSFSSGSTPAQPVEPASFSHTFMDMSKLLTSSIDGDRYKSHVAQLCKSRGRGQPQNSGKIIVTKSRTAKPRSPI